MLTSKQKQMHDKLNTDFPFFAEKALVIRDKAGNIVPFILNKAQRHVHRMLEEQKRRIGKVRAVVVKGRQEGVSTYIEGRYYHNVTRNPGKAAFILSHEAQTTEKLFNMVNLYHERCPGALRPEVESKNHKRMVFKDIASSYTVGTAGNKDVGRGGTAQYFHGSEAAYWENADDIARGLLQSFPDLDGTEIILESTGNGTTGFFYEKAKQALQGIGEYILIFIPWFWQDEYRKKVPDNFEKTEEEAELAELFGLDDEQIFWRRIKIIELGSEASFKQEYPNTVMEAFQTSGGAYYDISKIQAARKRHIDIREFAAPRIGGFDAASEEGPDAMTLAIRQGRKLWPIQEFKGSDKQFNNIVGTLAKVIMEEDLDKLFIDKGYGDFIASELKTLGFGDIVTKVSFAGKCLDPEKYVNKRAEMHDLYRQWLNHEEPDIPDSDALEADMLMVPKEKLNTLSKQVIPSKERIREANNGLSPNMTDATVLTFAMPVAPRGVNSYHKLRNRKKVEKKESGSPLRARRRVSSKKTKRLGGTTLARIDINTL